MDFTTLYPWLLPLLFLLAALIYSSVGLGGGSSYTAMLAIAGFSNLVIPTLSLSLNLVVTTAASYNFIRRRHAKLKLITPFLLSSIPCAYIGGALSLPKQLFYWLLLLSLVFVALRIYLWRNTSLQLQLGQGSKWLLSVSAGSLLGLVAGIVGIGGGIYLVPLIIILGLGSEKEAAACGAIFVWLNSLAGLVARMQYNPVDLLQHLHLVIAVAAGGVLGSMLGSTRLSPRTMEQVLGGIILVAIVLLSHKLMT